MTAKTRVGVVGTGYLGRLHARVLTEMPEAEVVGFVDSSGNVDRTLIVVDLNRATMFAGVTAEVSNAIDLSAQAYGVHQDGVTFRFGGGYRLYR